MFNRQQENSSQVMPQARTRPRKENMYSGKDSPQVVYVTPSYRLVVIPKSKENPIVMASHGHRSKLAAQVLNNEWVCVPPAPFKQHRLQINQYQEVLNKCEEEHFEFDMLFKSFRSVSKNVDKLLKESGTRVSVWRKNLKKVELQLSASNLKCIERTYGKEGLVALDKLHRGPTVCIAYHIQSSPGKASDCNKNLAQVMLKTITSHQ